MACFHVNFIGSMRNRRTNQRRIANTEPTSVADDEIPAAAVKIKKFKWEELKKAADDFSNLIGSGGLSNVYLANSSVSTLAGAAVKIIQCGGSERLSRVFRQELDISRQIQHENIVKLIGYSQTQEEGALIFEYIPNGTLQEKLHSNEILSWKARMVIAFQLAGAIQYLHDKCSLHIVHGDIKPSNILLDDNLNCKLCDFGSAKMGFSSMVLPTSPFERKLIMGSPGYVDPHLLRTGIASKKSDVYSFGVILLELVTGMEAFCPEKGRMLTSVIGAETVEMVDPRLEGNFILEEAKTVSLLAGLCLGTSPSLRPSAADILVMMTEKITSIRNEQKVS